MSLKGHLGLVWSLALSLSNFCVGVFSDCHVPLATRLYLDHTSYRVRQKEWLSLHSTNVVVGKVFFLILAVCTLNFSLKLSS